MDEKNLSEATQAVIAAKKKLGIKKSSSKLKPTMSNYVVYRPNETRFSGFKLTGDESESYIRTRIISALNSKAIAGIQKPVLLDDFDYMIVRGEPNFKCAWTTAKSRGLTYKKPFKKNFQFTF